MKSKNIKILFTLFTLTSCTQNSNLSISTNNNSLDQIGYKQIQIDNSIRELTYANYVLPSLTTKTNNPKMLVVPVEFPDCTAKEKGYSIDLIREAFTGNGDKEKRSVESFYRNSSYGKCNLEIDFYPTWYQTKHTTDVYTKLEATYFDGAPAVTSIMKDFILDNDKTIDFSQYDSDNDGYIDSIYFIYTYDVDYLDKVNQDLWWAFKYQYRGTEPLIVDNVEPMCYVWAGYQFMFENGQECNINTYIHESGHLFGLDDYYDYSPNEGAHDGGLGTKDLMDNTIGDHNPFSKMLLGWANNPTIVTTTNEINIDLKAFQRNGDFIILTNKWDYSLGLYQEYFILEYYTPDNMHAYDKIFTVPGIRVFHVNAKKIIYKNGYTSFLYDNSYTEYKLLTLVAFNKGEKLLKNAVANDTHLFTKGEFLLTAKYDDGSYLNYQFSVNSLNNDFANITIKYTPRLKK